jgi:imidazole glycerol-phosphate synthase subunit HisF
MVPARLIPCLLLRGAGCVKTVRFRKPVYLGDPINVVRIFNEREVDELILLDIDACREGRGPRFARLADLASECFMPVCYGGGVRSLGDVERLFAIGIEKVSINTHAVLNPALVEEAVRRFGSQSIVASVDVRKGFFGGRRVVTCGGRRAHALDPVVHAREMERRGAGEVLLNSVDRDGVMRGYDLALVGEVSAAVRVPVVALGGAGSLADAGTVLRAGAAAAAAGSLFCFAGPDREVLINYPDRGDIDAELQPPGPALVT